MNREGIDERRGEVVLERGERSIHEMLDVGQERLAPRLQGRLGTTLGPGAELPPELLESFLDWPLVKLAAFGAVTEAATQPDA